MKKIILMLVFMFCFCGLAWAENETGECGDPEECLRQKDVREVSTVPEFFEALGSNRVIVLRPGEYNLSEFDPRLVGKSVQGNAFYEAMKNKNIHWDEIFDGSEVRLEGFTNLEIRGTLNDKDERMSKLIIDPRYAFVLVFNQAKHIYINDLEVGHSEGGNCLGGVFSFKDSSNIGISGSGLFGSGTEGLALDNVTAMRVYGSTIYECTYDIMTIINSSDIVFHDCVFRNNREFVLVQIEAGKDIIFDQCLFDENQGPLFGVRNADGVNVLVRDCRFTNNTDQNTLEQSYNVIFEDCVYE